MFRKHQTLSVKVIQKTHTNQELSSLYKVKDRNSSVKLTSDGRRYHRSLFPLVNYFPEVSQTY